MREAYDYVIVGAGSAGCVLASRLSEDPRVHVIVIEGGPEDDNAFIAMPLGAGRLMGIGGKAPSGKSYFYHYSISPGPDRAPENWVKGRAVGGSSSINGSVYMRGLPSDYDHWEALGCRGWGWQTIGRCFREIENHELGPGEWRGGEGPLRVSIPKLDRLGKATLEAFAEAGTRQVPDVNDFRDMAEGGVGAQPCTIWRGRRVSAAGAFLRPARGRPNLHVITDTDVVGIAFDQLTATGVQVRAPDGIRTIRAEREIILSAGALHSPQLLQLSGIGPAALLKHFGIEVRVDAPNVGRNLQDHRTVITGYRLKRGGRNRQLRGPGLIASVLKYALAGRGALANPFWEIGGLIKTAPGLAAPDCQIGVNFMTYDFSGVHAAPGMAIYGYVLQPQSRGEVSIASADSSTPPTIVANFLAEESDRRHTVALFRYMRTVARQPALAPYIDFEDMPGPGVTSDEDLVEESFRQGGCAMHVTSSCRMGSDEGAVVDPDLRVRGVRGLRVVDTSIMPTIPSANPNGPILAMAWHAAERIRGA